MEKPWFNFRFLVVFMALALVLTSCLDLNVSVDFKTSTSGQVKVDALAWRLAQNLQVVEGDDLVVFPSTQAQWQDVVDHVPDASLVSWQGQDEDRGFRSSTVVSFATARALEGLFVAMKQKLTLLSDNQNKWTITFVPQVPRVTAANSETRQLWSELWGPVVWTFRFTPPGQPPTEKRVTLAELADSEPPAEWKLSW